MDSDDREKFERLITLLDDMNHRLFDVEEALSRLGPNSPNFVELNNNYNRLVNLLQEVHSAAFSIAQRYGQ